MEPEARGRCGSLGVRATSRLCSKPHQNLLGYEGPCLEQGCEAGQAGALGQVTGTATCVTDDKDLPSVPPLELSVPADYPAQSPLWINRQWQYGG